MNFQLITLLGVKHDEEVYEVILPTAAGEIAVFPGHEHLVSIAITGAIGVRKRKGDSELEHYAITGGVIEVTPQYVKVLVDEAERGDEIVEAEAAAALKRAQDLHSRAKDQVELEHAKQLIDRHTVRLHVAGLRRHRR